MKEKNYGSPWLLLELLCIHCKFIKSFDETLPPSSNKQSNSLWLFRYPKPCQLVQLLFAGKLAYRLKNEGAKVRLCIILSECCFGLDFDLQLKVCWSTGPAGISLLWILRACIVMSLGSQWVPFNYSDKYHKQWLDQ